MPLRVMVRGGGDISSGVAYRLARAGWQVFITELLQPQAVRRLVSYSQAIYDRQIIIEGIEGCYVDGPAEAELVTRSGRIAVLVDPTAGSRFQIKPHVFIDGRMTKRPPDVGMDAASLVIGLGPGFQAGVNCHAVVETQRGASMGHVYWQGTAEADTGLPDLVGDHRTERVLRAPCDGVIQTHAELGSLVESGQVVADVAGCEIRATFRGCLRGMIHPGLTVSKGLKVGDIDPRQDCNICAHISDKALGVSGGVLEAILSRSDLRPILWQS
ncbi:MAG: selenium-dependent molybdenum cofactor biosynthesis protein YqeB [Anaerolineaceae bacterium]|nr:selenium-dependent molybdenum cofactor biosynthesis protein YqeB [Anaerolineaceae bacterium]